MSVYSYQQSKIIDEVAFQKTPGGAVRAYLHIKEPPAEPNMPHVIVEAFRNHGWQATPTSENGKPELELRGFKNENQLLAELSKKEWISGSPAITKDKEGDTKLTDKIRSRSLFASSFVYFLGDYKFFKYGQKSGQPLDMAAGINYFAGSLASFLFGRKDASDLQINDLSQKMADYLNQQNIKLPPEASLNNIVDDHHKGIIKKSDDFLRRYPAELMNTFFGLAGVCVAMAAYGKLRKPIAPKAAQEYVERQITQMQRKFPNTTVSAIDKAAMQKSAHHLLEKMHRRSNMLDIGLGSLTATSGTIATLMPEKAHDPDEPEKKGFAGALDWVQQHPMSVAGGGYMVATMCHAASTAIEYTMGMTSAKSAIFDRGIFVVTNLIAEMLVAISSKGHGEGVVSDKSVDNTVLALAAEIIAREPPKMQEELIDHVAIFLGRPDTLAMKDDEVKSTLREQVEVMRKNPWATKIPATSTKNPQAWQKKVSAETPSPQLSA